MPTANQSKKDTTFDVSKYTVSQNTYTKTLTISETDESFEVTIKPISWARRNQLITDNMSWDTDGNTQFDASTYMRTCLREMIVEAPWGKTTESFLISIDSRLGGALEELVPQAFGVDNGIDAETVKKGR